MYTTQRIMFHYIEIGTAPFPAPKYCVDENAYQRWHDGALDSFLKNHLKLKKD